MAEDPQGIALAPLVYLDSSALGRLSDTIAALAVEGAQVQRIVDACTSGRLRLLTSEVLALEVADGPPQYRARSEAVLASAVRSVAILDTLRQAARLDAIGIPFMDALQIAAAVVGGARYAVSCDRHWLRNAARIAHRFGPTLEIVSPADLVRSEGL